VSPVSTARPAAKSMSSRSIRTMSRIERRVSMGRPVCTNQAAKLRRFGARRLASRSSCSRAQRAPAPPTSATTDFLAVGFGIRHQRADAEPLERLAHPRALVFLRLDAAGLHEAVGVLVPGAVGEIVPE